MKSLRKSRKCVLSYEELTKVSLSLRLFNMKGLLSILLGNPHGHHRRAALTYGSLPGSTGELVITKLIVVVSNLSGTASGQK